MTGHPGFWVPGATAALLDYLGAKRPELPRIQLYFELSGTLVAAAGKYDLISDWYMVEDVVREVELRLGECFVATRPRTAGPVPRRMGPRDQMIGRYGPVRRRPPTDFVRRPLSSPQMSGNRHRSSSFRRNCAAATGLGPPSRWWSPSFRARLGHRPG